MTVLEMGFISLMIGSGIILGGWLTTILLGFIYDLVGK